MREDAGFVAKTLYRYGTSKSPVKRGIATGVLSLIEATGSKERTAKKNFEATEQEKEALRKFLNNKATQNVLEKVGVNSRAFNVVAFRGYPFNSGKYDMFLRAFVTLRNELREHAGMKHKLNPSKYDDIIKRMIKYENGDTITTHSDYIPEVVLSEDDSDDYSEPMHSDEQSEQPSEDQDDDSESHISGISNYNKYLGYLDNLPDFADKETLSSRRNSVMRSLDNELSKLQVGGFCYNETSKLKNIIAE